MSVLLNFNTYFSERACLLQEGFLTREKVSCPVYISHKTAFKNKLCTLSQLHNGIISSRLVYLIRVPILPFI